MPTAAQNRATAAAERSGNPAKKAAAAPRKIAAKKTATQASPSITITADPVKKVTVELVGERYTVTPPKASLAISITQQARDGSSDDAEAAFDQLNGWMDTAFGTKVKQVRARLADPSDQLDLQHIMQLMNALLDVGGESPTT